MKKLLIGTLAIIAAFSLVACGEKENVQTSTSVVENSTPTPVIIDNNTSEVSNEVEQSGEQVGVGNTDEGMVFLALEQYFKNSFGDEFEELNTTNIKVYTEKEIANDEALKTYTINEGDIVFSVDYELKIAEGTEDLMKYTAGTGEIDGQWIRNKSNVGIVRNDGTIDSFGTAF